MRILFMGTGDFAVPTLKALVSSKHAVIGVVTQPDRPSGRGRQIAITPAKRIASNAGIPVYQPERVTSKDFIDQVRALAPDAFVVAAFGQIIPKDLLDVPGYGGINVHASLLPKYRGAAPVHHALFNGERKTGATTMLMDVGLDTGPILLQREVEIGPDDNEGALEARLAEVGAELLLETLEGLETGAIEPQPQDDSRATRAPAVKREDCAIDWRDSAISIVNRVRGCTPKPGAFTFMEGMQLKVWSCDPAAERGTPGVPGEVTQVGPQGVEVAAGCGSVVLREVQPENRRRMTAGEFARGYRISKGAVFRAAQS